jgi:hypothetical protein
MSQSSKHALLLARLREFYADPAHIQRILPILTSKSRISLRLIDWFVTNYLRRNQVTLRRTDDYFLVYSDYKAQLQSFSKKQFDPFCRRDRIEFCYDGINVLETTVGQLNFFKWLIRDNILDYIEENAEQIEKDMNERSKRLSGVQDSSSSSGRKPRHSGAATIQDCVAKRHIMPTFVKFGAP